MKAGVKHRRGLQIQRTLQVIDLMREKHSVSLSELQDSIKPKVCERTLRRDVIILMNMGWVNPIDDANRGTRWVWVKD